MRALLDDATVVHHDDPVGVLRLREPVRHDDGRATPDHGRGVLVYLAIKCLVGLWLWLTFGRR